MTVPISDRWFATSRGWEVEEMQIWEELARDRWSSLNGRAHVVDPDHDKPEMAEAWKRLRSLKWLGQGRDGLDGRHHVLDWWSGARVDSTWNDLHAAEEGITASEDEVEIIRAARTHLAGDSESLKKLEADLHEATSARGKRAIALAAVQHAHLTSNQKHISEHQTNRAVVVFTGLLLVLAAALLPMQAYLYQDNAFLDPPAGTTIGSTSFLVLGLTFGLVGGAISALTSLYLTPKVTDDTMWFDPRPALAALKVVLGAWTAFLGLLMVSTGWIVGTYTSIPAAILLALVFGYGQQAVTGTLLDRYVAKLTEEPKG